jgi:hypothetical protein
MSPRRAKGNSDGSRSVKISSETHRRLETLIAWVSQNGWSSLGLNRSDRPSIAAMLDAAVEQLPKRKQPRPAQPSADAGSSRGTGEKPGTAVSREPSGVDRWTAVGFAPTPVNEAPLQRSAERRPEMDLAATDGRSAAASSGTRSEQ